MTPEIAAEVAGIAADTLLLDNSTAWNAISSTLRANGWSWRATGALCRMVWADRREMRQSLVKVANLHPELRIPDIPASMCESENKRRKGARRAGTEKRIFLSTRKQDCQEIVAEEGER
jgi:hypothetical protein